MTKSTTTSKTSWINSVSNDTSGLEIGLASMSLTSNISVPLPSFSGIGEDFSGGLQAKTHVTVSHGKENDELDYSTCSESGDESPPERSTSYLSPIGVNNNASSCSSPSYRRNTRSELFGGESLSLLEVRSDRAENSPPNLADSSYFVSNACHSGDRLISVSSNVSRGKDEASLSSIGSDFCYSGTVDENVEQVPYLSARSRAKSVPTLSIDSPVNNNVVRSSGIPQMPFTDAWDESRLRRNRSDGEVLDEGKLFNQASSLLDGLRKGTVPVEDGIKYNGETTLSSNVLENGFGGQKGGQVSRLQESLNSNFLGSNQATLPKEPPRVSPSSVNTFSSYPPLGRTEGPCHQLRHSMPDVFIDNHYNDVLSPRKGRGHIGKSNGICDEFGFQKEERVESYEDSRRLDENIHFNRNQTLYDDGIRSDNFMHPQRHDHRYQHIHHKTPFTQIHPSANSPQSLPQYLQPEMLGHPGFNDFHSKQYENPRYPSQHRRIIDSRHEYRNNAYGPPPRVLVSNPSTASTPPPLVPRTSYADEYDSSPIRVSCPNGMNRGGHHRVLSCNSVGNHSHATMSYQNRIPTPEAENRVRCHSYGGQGSMQSNFRGDFIQTVMHPSRYEYQEHHMLLSEPVLVNNEAEYHSVASSGSHSVDFHGMHLGMPITAVSRHSCTQEYQSNSDHSSNRCNNFVTRNELPNTLAMSNVPLNQVTNTLMVRSVPSNPNERAFDNCSPSFVNIDDYDEANMAIMHPQFVVSQNPSMHFGNRPHSSSTSSLERLQAIPQFVGSEAPSAPANPRVVYNVKFKRTQRSFISGPRAPRDIKIGCYVKVEADRGEDLGFVVSRIPAEKFNASGRSNFRVSAGVDGTDSSSSAPLSGSAADLKRVVRLATREEVALIAAKREEEDELLKICRSKVKNRGLAMNVVDAEYQFDRHKLTFFFEAEGRIDFRELVRDLFSIYKTRIWMQQLDKNGVGINDIEETNDLFPPPEVVISDVNSK